ncbi:MAG: nucleotidyltransferase family protein [Acidimicrobiales bacterium]
MAVTTATVAATSDLERAEAVMRGVAAYGLPGATRPLPTAPLPDGEWRAMLSGVREERLTGLLLYAVEEGAFPVTAEQAAAAAEAHLEATCQCVQLERTLLDVAALLEDAGVDVRVLKGPALARLDYPDPSLRCFRDVDVLVRSGQWDAAVAALEAAGNQRLHPEPRPGFDRRFSKGTTFRTADRHEIDLHRTFALGPFGLTVDLDDVWARSSQFELGGGRLQSLDPEVRFLNVCAHAALGDVPPRLVPLRDIAEILLVGGRLDVQRVIRLAERWRAEIVVARALELCRDTLGLSASTTLTDWAGRLRPDRRQRRALELYLDRRETYVALLLGTVRVIPGVRAKATYLTALACPERQFVDGRHASRWSRFRYAARVGRRLWPGRRPPA